eukprot:gene4489-4919_t
MKGFSINTQPIFNNPALAATLPTLRLADIGFNAYDDVFRGSSHGKASRPDDLEQVLQRAKSLGVESLLCSAGNAFEAKKTFQFIRDWQDRPCHLQGTVGVHPTRCKVFEHGIEPVISELKHLINEGISEGYIAAIGECGLDYDRLHFCPKELQIIGFQAQLELAKEFHLPLFLHDRNTNGHFLRIIEENLSQLPAGGVVHSFTGSMEELKAYCDLGLYISVNGCSLKTEEGLEMVAAIPEELLLLETDAPWCTIKNSHAGSRFITTKFPLVKKEKFEIGCMIRDRNEPCTMIHVVEAVAQIRQISVESLASQVLANTYRLFPSLALR